jgi:hypothetical protein
MWSTVRRVTAAARSRRSRSGRSFTWDEVAERCGITTWLTPGLVVEHLRGEAFVLNERDLETIVLERPADAQLEYIAELVEVLRSGGSLPPALVARPSLDEPPEFLDGFHRAHAARLAGRTHISVFEQV